MIMTPEELQNLKDDLFQVLRERGPFSHANHIDAQYKITNIEFLEAQRTLIDEQRSYTKTIKHATWIMALATVVIAIFSYLQWHESSKTAERFQKLQVPELREK